MIPKERVRTVYAGQCPDQVPLLLDLSHWYKKNRGVPFNLAGLAGSSKDWLSCINRLAPWPMWRWAVFTAWRAAIRR